MSTRQDHLKFIKEMDSFTIDCCRSIFTAEEIQIIEKYGHWYMALTTGQLEPVTVLQKEFVLVATKQNKPVTLEQQAWFKYLGRKAVEAKFGDQLHVQYHPINDDTFYTREMVKKQKKMMFKEMKENHRK